MSNGYIRLGTPPPSPPRYIYLADTESPPRVLSRKAVVTPTRKQRSGSTKILTKARHKRHEKPQAETQMTGNSTLEDGPDWDMAAPELITGSEPSWNSADTVTADKGDFNMESGDERGYSEYCEAIQEEGGSFYQISVELFVVSGWDARAKTSKSTWYHLQRSTIGKQVVTVCRCPLAKPNEPCVHEEFLTEYGAELFPTDFATSETDNVVLFSRQEIDEGVYINHFSAPSPNSRALNGRVIVEYSGDDSGCGQWICSKDNNAGQCAHINKCRNMLQKLVLVDPTAKDNRIGDGCSIDYSVPQSRRSAREINSVSHLPIASPLWAALDSDPSLYQRSPALEGVPNNLPLTETSSCSCAQPRDLFDSTRTTTRQTCTVYGLFRSWETLIEIQSCNKCSHRVIGPDCRELGIFNYNNRKLFAHDLMDDYTSAYTSSETPFSAWVSVIERRYTLHSGEQPFVSAQLFRAAWFAYAKLQYLEGDMMCPRCGPSPENTIWDGVTLAFNRKHLLPTLEPPTTSQRESIERGSTKYVPTQQLLPEKKIRVLVRRVITGQPLTLEVMKKAVTSGLDREQESEEDDENESEDDIDGRTNGRRGIRAERAAARARADMLERLEAIPLAVQALKSIDIALGELFEAKFGEGTVLGGLPAPDVYRRLFIQISAEESVLQMVTVPAMDALEAFVVNPTQINASSLVEIPAIHELLSYERRTALTFSNTTVAVCRWILNRSRIILNILIKGPVPPRIAEGYAEKPWTETGCCYGLKKIRERPRYPKLKHDVRNEVGGKRGAKCSKFYSQYGERRLTGGIMVVWCTHSISYGFHCIPRGEGRNDVFSALITRWESAPKRVIYDFACALGPYCMTREPEFFSKTQFLIDDFHAVGHTKCSPAAFLKTHCNVDARLSHINSSAGECGNSGIARIRKSVSYMSQARAILYSKVFLSIWNRQRIRGLN